MSRESVQALLDEVERDADLRAEFEDLFDAEQPVNEFLTLAGDRGYDFDVDELLAELKASEELELDDDDLDSIVGGGPTSMSSFSLRTLRLLRSYTTAPSIGSIGPGIGSGQEVEEEEIQL